MSAQPPPPAPLPDPKLDATSLSSALPQSQLENLRYKITQITESIGGLIVTLNTPHGAGVAGGLAGWPELMTKYNVLLSKTHSLAASLGAPPTRKGQTSLKQIAPHPFAVDGGVQAQAQGQGQGPGGAAPSPAAAAGAATGAATATATGANPTAAVPAPGQPVPPAPPTGLDPQLDAMLDALLDGRRAPSVLKNDITNVERLRVSNVDTTSGIGMIGTRGGAGGGVNVEELRAMEARLDEIKRAHDARCARGVEAVRQLKDKYDWKSRLLFDDSDTSPSGTVAGSDADSTHADEEAAGQEDEDMVEVAPEHEREELTMDPGMDTEDGTPTHTVFVPAAEDSDSSSDEDEESSLPLQTRGLQADTSLGVGINGDLAEGDGSDSDGMEDVSVPPPFVPPLYQNGDSGTQTHHGQQGQPPPEESSVSALDSLDSGLWVIDP